eukprot:2531583-Alexandrium_andersonii.AAC.1
MRRPGGRSPPAPLVTQPSGTSRQTGSDWPPPLKGSDRASAETGTRGTTSGAATAALRSQWRK